MSNEMSRRQQVDTVRGALEKLKPQMSMALPKHLTPDRLLRVTMTAVQNNPKLLDCDRTSLFASVLTCAQLGLEPDGVLGQAYLVPFRGKVQFIPGYKGYLTLARNSGEISSIQAHEVCQNDEFSYAYGLDEHLHHVPAAGERGEITHFYAYAKYKDGGHTFEVMTRGEVDAVRDNSEGYKAFKRGQIKTNPWDSHYPQMGRKTAIRRLANYLPLMVQRAAALDSAYDQGVHAKTDDYGDVVIDGEGREIDETRAETGASGATGRLDQLAGEDESEPGTGLDVDGIPWDERIHSTNKTKTDDGRWRRKRGIDNDEYKRVVAELKLAQAGPVPTGPDPEDPITQTIEKMEATADRDKLDEIADEAMHGTDIGEPERERLTAAYKRNCERLQSQQRRDDNVGAAEPAFGDDD